MKRLPGGRAVYSTDPQWTPPCETCGLPRSRCRCTVPAPSPAAGGTARLRLETKGRGGKAVTVIVGLGGPAETLRELARALKEACGTGGTVKDGAVELQGDHRERAAAALRARGIAVKT